ncbi:VC2046/SO_2500 family protein [Vibrio sp.]|uniref:VC2046/SO_2500 family protein n=1 Tax=Vibrio sp. TaxID=678 RepID=UPI003D0ECCD1
MQIHTLDKAAIINELQFGTGINRAVYEGRRADFALTLALFSDDVRDNTPVEQVEQPDNSEQRLRQQFGLQELQPLRSSQDSYPQSAKQAQLFHSAGLASAKLCHYLVPEPLTYLPEATHDLDEAVYHNLSGHQRRHLSQPPQSQWMPATLYNQLVSAQRQFQIMRSGH